MKMRYLCGSEIRMEGIRGWIKIYLKNVKEEKETKIDELQIPDKNCKISRH
jgi:hypothetical protein